MDNEKIKSIAGALTNLIVNALLLFNMYRQLTGQPAFEIGAENISITINAVLLAISQIWLWWKNNNMTSYAQAGQFVTDALKDNQNVKFSGEKTDDSISINIEDNEQA